MNKRKKKYIAFFTDAIMHDERDYLYTADSQIAGSGMGLFTAIRIYQYEVIARFKGRILPDAVAKSMAEQQKDAWFINMPDGAILDCSRTSCFAKWANDADGFTKSRFRNNSMITLDEDNEVCIVAIKHISAGAEIFCSYGKRYWQNYRSRVK